MRKFCLRNCVVGLLFFIIVYATSCSTPKNTAYFQTVPPNSEIQTLVTKDFEHKVKPDDILAISVTSPSEDIKNYNLASDGYLVDKNGNIQLYKLGEIKVLDLTLAQIQTKITKLLVPDYFKDATISVRFRNHRIVVLGEIGAPGVIPMETEHLSILEAISMKGDLRENAKRDNILVIRNSERGKQFFRINLLDGSVFNSPFYYLQADDIVYIEPDIEKKKANSAQVYGYVISGLSFLFLIFDRFTR